MDRETMLRILIEAGEYELVRRKSYLGECTLRYYRAKTKEDASELLAEINEALENRDKYKEAMEEAKRILSELESLKIEGAKGTHT